MAGGTQNVSKFEVDGHVARITLNRPEAMNSLNPELRWELSQHYDEVERNDDIWLAVVTGAGDRAFCAGADLKHRARERDADAAQKAYWEKLVGDTKSLIEPSLHLQGGHIYDFEFSKTLAEFDMLFIIDLLVRKNGDDVVYPNFTNLFYRLIRKRPGKVHSSNFGTDIFFSGRTSKSISWSCRTQRISREAPPPSTVSRMLCNHFRA